MSGGYLSGGNCPGGNCPGGNCPDTSEHTCHGLDNYTVLQKYAHIGFNQNLFRSTTLDIVTRLLDNAVFVCVHVVGRFSKDFSEVRG